MRKSQASIHTDHRRGHHRMACAQPSFAHRTVWFSNCGYAEGRFDPVAAVYADVVDPGLQDGLGADWREPPWVSRRRWADQGLRQTQDGSATVSGVGLAGWL